MQLAGYIFLDRKWEDDKENITRCLKVFQKIGYRPQVRIHTFSLDAFYLAGLGPYSLPFFRPSLVLFSRIF